ncbi:MAG: nucleotide exchange factor GrpE, partial [Pseudomonadota bacterium]
MNTTPEAAGAAPPSPPSSAAPGSSAPQDRGGTAAPQPDAAGRPVAEQLAELQVRHAEVSDAYLRAKAEAENIRRRAEAGMAPARKFAIEAFAGSRLPGGESLRAATSGAHAA